MCLSSVPLYHQILFELCALVRCPACLSSWVCLVLSLPKGFMFNLSGIQDWTLYLGNLALILSNPASPCLVETLSIIISQKEFYFLDV